MFRFFTKAAFAALAALLLTTATSVAGYPNSGPGTLTDFSISGTITSACAQPTGCASTAYFGSILNNSTIVRVTASGTFTAGCVADESGDGSHFTTPLVLVVPNSSNLNAASFSAAGQWDVYISGSHFFQIRCTSYTSGTVNITLHFQSAGPGGPIDASGNSETDIANFPAKQAVTCASGSPGDCHVWQDNVGGPAQNAVGTGQWPTYCPKSFDINISASGDTIIVTGSTGLHIHICGIDLIANGQVSVTIDQGGGAGCATNLAHIAGPYSLTAQSGFARGNSLGETEQELSSGNNWCLNLSAAVQVGGIVQYEIASY